MISIREGVFESNSSSQHSLVVPVVIRDDNYVKKEIEKLLNNSRIHVEPNKLMFILDDIFVQGGDFTIRDYIPHYSISDKLLYVVATVIQHYQSRIIIGPSEGSKDYQQKFLDWTNQGAPHWNEIELRNFERDIYDLETRLADRFNSILQRDDRNKIKIKIKYTISKNHIINTGRDEKSIFYTGCYNNEEFYCSLDSSYYGFVDWICNPYSAVLAGSDEMSDEKMLQQVLESKRLLDESWERYKKRYIEDYQPEDPDKEPDLILNSGRIIWPIGG